VKQREHFDRAIPTIFMGLGEGMSIRLPGVTGIGLGLIRAGFIFTPHTQPHHFANAIGLFDEFFLLRYRGP
jgi:hypothetical protein